MQHLEARAATGIKGLDEALRGRFTRGHAYLVAGDPGSGKTTLGLQFLLAGCAEDEAALYVTLSESESDIHEVARSHGLDLSGIDIVDLEARSGELGEDDEYTFFRPSQIELGETIRAVLQHIERVRPQRLVVDSMSELRMLAESPLRHRRNVLLLKASLAKHGTTALLLDYQDPVRAPFPIESVVHGVIRLQRTAPAYGGSRRQLEIEKMRGSDFSSGYHDFAIRRGGLEVFPRLVAREQQGHVASAREPLSSGVEELDGLLDGGLDAGTSTMFLGPSGVGKSSLSSLYAAAACARGIRARLYSFDEAVSTWVERARSIGLDIPRYERTGSSRRGSSTRRRSRRASSPRMCGAPWRRRARGSSSSTA